MAEHSSLRLLSQRILLYLPCVAFAGVSAAIAMALVGHAALAIRRSRLDVDSAIHTVRSMHLATALQLGVVTAIGVVLASRLASGTVYALVLAPGAASRLVTRGNRTLSSMPTLLIGYAAVSLLDAVGLGPAQRGLAALAPVTMAMLAPTILAMTLPIDAAALAQAQAARAIGLPQWSIVHGVLPLGLRRRLRLARSVALSRVAAEAAIALSAILRGSYHYHFSQADVVKLIEKVYSAQSVTDNVFVLMVLFALVVGIYTWGFVTRPISVRP
jgi:hypothetical protein